MKFLNLKYLPLIITLIPISAYAESVRLQRLTEVYETNEAGFAYFKHCGDLKKAITDHPFFMQNSGLVVSALAKEIVANNTGATLEQASQKITDRSKVLQASFDDFYKRNSCDSSQAIAAKKGIALTSDTPPEKMSDFLNSIEMR